MSVSIKIPQGREDLRAKLIKLYSRTLPEEVVDIIEQVQLSHQFSSTDEYSFRERVGYELQEAVLELKSNHILPSVEFWLEIDACVAFICGWLSIMELGLPEDVKSKIISEEFSIISRGLIAEANKRESYEVVRNFEVFHMRTSSIIINKYVHTQAG